MKNTMKSNWIKTFSSLIFMLFISSSLIMAQRTITGTITDFESGDPLIGANILVKGYSTGTITDFDGNYALDIPADAVGIVITYTGFSEQEIPLTASNVYNAQLQYGELLSEVVVIGYGTVERKDATGSVQTVGSESFNQGAITSPQELLAGKISGVTIITGGDPGGGSKIRIRGESSLGASNDPLIVIDGVPIENAGVSGARNPLNIINPNDIETFTVLKDASSTAIYGNRASAGVILITTKKGKVGSKMKLNYSGNVSVGNNIRKVDVLDAEDFIQALKDNYGETHKSLNVVGDANTDWQEEIYESAIGHDHNLSLTGAVKEFPYRVSIGYTDKSGVLLYDNFKRYTAGINVSPSFLDNTLQVNFHFKGSLSNNSFSDRGAIGNALSFDPTQEVYSDTTLYEGFNTWTDPEGNPQLIAPTNPVALLELRDDNSEVFRYITGANIDYRMPFMSALRANFNIAYDYSSGAGTLNIPNTASFSFDALNGGGADNEYDSERWNRLLEFYLNYKKDYGIHGVDLMGGYSWQHFKDRNWWNNNDAAHTPEENVTGEDQKELYLLSLFGRLNYTLNDTYLFTFSVRRDGTSRFAPENRWGLFPAAAVAVKIFENDKPLFNDLKLRLGWGITGQENIGNYYAYLPNYEEGFENASYQFGNTFYQTLRPNGYDRNIKWEETTTLNVGLDFSVVQDRLSGSFEVYNKNTKDLLNEISIAAGTNLTNILYTNIGKMETNGIELSLNTTPVLTKDLIWDLSANAAYSVSEITKLTAIDDPEYIGYLTGGISGGVGSQIQIMTVGNSPNSFYVYEQLYDENGDILEGEFNDRDGNGEVNELDKYRNHFSAPKYTFGVTSRLEYKGLDFSFAGRAHFGNYAYNNIQTDMGWLGRMYSSSGALFNVNSSAVELNVSDQANLTYSDHFVSNASFFKMDHITLGYDMTPLIKKSSRVYFTVQNPFIVTEYGGLDPELDNGIDNNIYPRPRTFLLGFNVSF